MNERRTNEQETIEARIGLAAAFRMAARLDMHEGVCNHFSFMLPERRFLINPKGLHFSRITASSIILMDEDGSTLEGTGAPTDGALHPHTRAPAPSGGQGGVAFARALFDSDHCD